MLSAKEQFDKAEPHPETICSIAPASKTQNSDGTNLNLVANPDLLRLCRVSTSRFRWLPDRC